MQRDDFSNQEKFFFLQKNTNIGSATYNVQAVFPAWFCAMACMGPVLNQRQACRCIGIFLQVFMFSLFKGPESAEVLKKRAKQAYEKVIDLTADTFEANRMRRGMALLCCAHLDKTFIAGAERMADWQQMAAFAVAKNEPPPPLPKADNYQKIRSGKADIWAYLPSEYSDSAFLFGAKYQRTELTSEQAIQAMQQLADNLCLSDIGLGFEIVVLKFLRQELSASEKQSDVHEDLSGTMSASDPE